MSNTVIDLEIQKALLSMGYRLNHGYFQKPIGFGIMTYVADRASLVFSIKTKRGFETWSEDRYPDPLTPESPLFQLAAIEAEALGGGAHPKEHDLRVTAFLTAEQCLESEV